MNQLRKRVAIYGGTFDPIHMGHCMVASAVLLSGKADEVWFMVSPQNPFKKGKHLSPDSDRLEMVRLVCREMCGLIASDFEFSLPRPSYTVTTLKALAKEWPEVEFRLIIGSDNWLEFAKWIEPETILEEFGLIVYPRPDYPIPDDFRPLANMPRGWEERIDFLENVPQALISSTYIREQSSHGKDITFLTPSAVAEYIRKKELYCATSRNE